MTELYLVRHGEPTRIAWGEAGAARPLTALGRAQAAQRGAWLAARGPFDALYCSPLVRARATARIVGAAVGLEPRVVPALAEWDPPFYTLPVRWLVDTFLGPASHSRVRGSAVGRGLRGDWWLVRVGRRRLPAWGRFVRRVGGVTAARAARHPGGRLILVSHGGTIRATLSTFGVPPPRLYHMDAVGLCSVSILHLPEDGGAPTVACFDDCATIPDRLPAE
jgi:broad specificity phosphatase PhoE